MAKTLEEALAAGAKTSSNPFGVMTLDAYAAQQLLQEREDMKDRQSLKGASYAAATFGNSLGQALRGYLTTQGIMEDPQQRKAAEISNAVDEARKAVKDQTFETPFDERIAQGDALVQHLDVMGYGDEADKVRNSLFTLRDAKLKNQQAQATLDKTIQDTTSKKQTSWFESMGKTMAGTIDDGTIEGPTALQVTPDGTAYFKGPDGSVQSRLPGEWTPVTVTGARGAVGPDKVETRTFDTRINGAAGAVRTMALIRKAIMDDPQSATFGNRLTGMLATAGGMARSFLVGTYGTELMSENSSKLDKFFKEAGIKDDVLQARISNMSYAIASSREGGKLTDQDVALAAKTAGALGNMLPEARIAAMDDFMLNTIDQIDMLAQTTVGAEKSPVYNGGWKNTIQGYKNLMNQYAVPVPGRDPLTYEKQYGLLPPKSGSRAFSTTTAGGTPGTPAAAATKTAEEIRAAGQQAVDALNKALEQ